MTSVDKGVSYLPYPLIIDSNQVIYWTGHVFLCLNRTRNSGTLQTWVSNNGKQWNPSTIKNWAADNIGAAAGRSQTSGRFDTATSKAVLDVLSSATMFIEPIVSNMGTHFCVPNMPGHFIKAS